jgi:hypothetical protein
MPLPTDAAGAEGDFAAQVPADLLHEIEGLNAIQDTLGNRMFHVSRAWTDGPMRRGGRAPGLITLYVNNDYRYHG